MAVGFVTICYNFFIYGDGKQSDLFFHFNTWTKKMFDKSNLLNLQNEMHKLFKSFLNVCSKIIVPITWHNLIHADSIHWQLPGSFNAKI